MVTSRLLFLVPVGFISACVSPPASMTNTPTATGLQSAGMFKAPAETSKSTALSSDTASTAGRDQSSVHGLLGEWLIENVDQRGVMDNVQLTLTFDGEGRVSGRLGCNAVAGRFTFDKSSLSFGPLISTRKMCGSPALMNQEALVLRSLQAINVVSWSDNGAAILSGPGGHSIVMRRVAPLSAPGTAHGNISPTPDMYRCANEVLGFAFEAGAAYLTEANGTLMVLNKIVNRAGDNTLETFTNGRATVFRQGGVGGHVRFARGRMAPVECQRMT
jgi:heat shock protein HslJ